MHQFTCHNFVEKPEFIDQMAEAAHETWGHLRPGWEHADRVDYYKKRCNNKGIEQMLVSMQTLHSVECRTDDVAQVHRCDV